MEKLQDCFSAERGRKDNDGMGRHRKLVVSLIRMRGTLGPTQSHAADPFTREELRSRRHRVSSSPPCLLDMEM